jgi:hypothetical protein
LVLELLFLFLNCIQYVYVWMCQCEREISFHSQMK